MSRFHKGHEQPMLPETLPVFPLRNALLLPQGRLPLNIFEPRYIAMTDHALAAGRYIGMVRPRDDRTDELYDIGCAGRIISCLETDDGRYMITLGGVSRFRIREELKADSAFRQVMPDWAAFADDLWPQEAEDPALREELLEILVDYLNEAGLSADWETIEGACATTIANSIAMSCPFGADEKQAILEATNIEERARTLIALMQMAVIENTGEAVETGDKPGRLQ